MNKELIEKNLSCTCREKRGIWNENIDETIDSMQGSFLASEV